MTRRRQKPLPLIVGESPSFSGRQYYHFPCSGAIGKRLCEFAGIPPEEEGSKYGRYYWALLERFEIINAIERHEDSVPWSVETARERVRDYLEEEPTDVVVALGARALDAVVGREVRGTPWCEWQTFAGRRVAKIPHPSGRNLLLNDPSMRERAGRILREAMGE